MKKLRQIIILLLTVLMFPAVNCFAARNQLPDNSLSSEGSESNNEWQIYSYLDSGYDVFVTDSEVTLINYEENDLRLYQDIRVKPKTKYIFTAEICVEGVTEGRGASLSIDNYYIDGAYVYSPSLKGNSDWQEVTLCFETVAKQRTIRRCLRLGGYCESSTGTAKFRNMTFCEAPKDAQNVQLLNPRVNTNQSSGNDSTIPEDRKIQLKSYMQLFVLLALIAGVVLLFGFYRYRDKFAARNLKDKYFRKGFLFLCLGGLVLRAALSCAFGGHDSDMSCWIGWGNYIANNGLSTFYTAPGHEWYDYPPGYMLFLGLLTKILNLLKISGYSKVGTFAYILPAYLADIGIACLLSALAREKGRSEGERLFLAGLVIFNPAAFILSGAWGQIDSILTLALMLSFRAFRKNKKIAAGLWFGAAVMIKWQALIYGPVFAVAYLLSVRDKKDIGKTAAAAAAALAVIFAVTLPFKGEQGLFWFAGKFFNATGGYEYASVEAYNFMSLIGGNWAGVNTPILGAVTYRLLGTLAILAAIIVCVLFQWHRQKSALHGAPSQTEDPAGLFLAAAFCMFFIFTFGHYMHERYVFPVIFLLMAAYLLYDNPRFLFCALLLSCVVFLNEMMAQYIVSKIATEAVRSTREHKDVVYICSLAEVMTFFIFLNDFLSAWFGDKEAEA